MIAIKIKNDAIIPIKNDENSIGYDLYSSVNINSNESKIIIDTDISLQIPKGYYGKIISYNNNQYYTITETIIESSKKITIKPTIENKNNNLITIKKGDIIAKLLIEKIINLPISEIVNYNIKSKPKNIFEKPNKIEIPFSPPKAPKNKSKYIDYIDDKTSYIKIPIIPVLNKNSIFVSYCIDNEDNIKDIKINQTLEESIRYVNNKKNYYINEINMNTISC